LKSVTHGTKQWRRYMLAVDLVFAAERRLILARNDFHLYTSLVNNKEKAGLIFSDITIWLLDYPVKG
jgi:hypothetical protein